MVTNLCETQSAKFYTMLTVMTIIFTVDDP